MIFLKLQSTMNHFETLYKCRQNNRIFLTKSYIHMIAKSHLHYSDDSLHFNKQEEKCKNASCKYLEVIQ
jgi:uncharacterized C2H2 Zn-finger protein